MKICADRRSADVLPDAACEAEAREAAGEFRAASLRMARALAEIERRGIHLLRTYSNARDYAVSALGLSGPIANVLLAAGRQLDAPAAAPETETETEPKERGERDAGPESADASVDGDGLFGGASGAQGDGDDDGDGDGDGRADADADAPPPSTVEDRLRDGALSLANAGQLDRLARALGGFSPEERCRWTGLAERSSEHTFRRLVGKEIEEIAQGVPTVTLQLHVSESARDDFRRAKVLASRQAGTMLTEGQVFAAMAKHFVRSLDKRAVGEKPRRTPHTKLRPGRRYVPAAVERAVLERDDDRCSVGDCTHDTFLELMHVRTPHALGGSREVDDLAAGCSRHHLLHDAGEIRFVGFDEHGKPLYRTRRGRLIRRSPPPEPPPRPRPNPPPDEVRERGVYIRSCVPSAGP